jgi:phosphatidylserine/phosphatidylglycerophosphate/cardiolipin synthase-like enzyme
MTALFLSAAASRPFVVVVFLLLLTGVGQAGRLASAVTLEVWYAPEDEPLRQVLRLYDHATRYIFVSVYGLTSPLAVKALVEAKKRGIDVRVITDRQRVDDEKQQIAVATLRLAGIPIRVNQHDGLMHLKQVVVDDEVNANGSMNHTTSGNRYNDERLDVIRDHAISVKAREKFLSLWTDADRFRPLPE